MRIVQGNAARVRREFAELTAIDAESLHERAMTDRLAEKLREIGFTVEEDGAGEKLGGEAGNLIGTLKGTLPGPPILLSGHTDTVSPGRGKRAVFHPDGRITSEGGTVLGGDDMTGVTAILEGIRATREAGLRHRDLEVVFSPAEELYCKGSGLLDRNRLRAEAGFVLDVSGPVGTAVIQAPSIVSFQVTVHGRASHAGFEPEQGIHAIQIMSRALAALPLGRLDSGTTRNVGLISGGSVTNAVPELCTARGEIRSFDHDRAMEALEEVRTVCAAAVEGTGAAVELASEVNFRAYCLPEDAAPLRYFDAACRAIGKYPAHAATFGGSDANQFNGFGIPTAVLSCGMYNCHTTEEFAELADIMDGAALVSCLIRMKAA